MIRTQIQLPESQVATLKQLAAINHTSMAELIRRAIEMFTLSPETGSIETRKQRAIKAVGKYRSGLSDVSVQHDGYLAEAFK